MEKRTRKILSWMFGILSGIAVLLAGAGTVAMAYQGKIAPNTFVGGVSVGGLSPDQAAVLLKSKGDQLNKQPVTLKIGSEQRTASYQDIGVSLEPAGSEIFQADSTTAFGWLAPKYWQTFITKKTLPIGYRVNETKFLKTVEKKFDLSNTAKNAKIKLKEDQLVVQEAVSGKQVDIQVALEELTSQMERGEISTLTFSYAETAAPVSTEAANQTKTEIIKALKPVTLIGDSRTFVLSAVDQYSLINYTPLNDQLDWEISRDKLQSLLSERVAGALNIAMIEKIIQRQPKAVLQEGKDGRAVVLATLVSSVYQRITEQNSSEAIAVPLVPVVFTSRIVEADYIPGLFEGIYVDINLAKQKMTIVNGEKALRSFIISSGKAGLPTPKGVFYIKNKIPLAQSRLYPGIWMRYWNALAKTPDGSGYEGYGIHDLPCFDKNCYYVEGAAHLGSPVSHGCVRLGHTDAQWFYKNIPIATPVNIH